jgi:hypothetical protein
MKRSLLTGFRALAFALSIFLLLALGGMLGKMKVHSATDVTLFVLGLAAFWVVIERLFVKMRMRPRSMHLR